MESATALLHRLTSYSSFTPDTAWDPPVDDPRVVRDLVVNDLERYPWFYKRYAPQLPDLALPRDFPTSTAPALGVLAGTAAVGRCGLDLGQLARLLHLCAGVVRTMQRPHAQLLFRSAGSAGGRFPIEVYVSVPEGGALPPGVWWYHPAEHSLVRVGEPPRGDTPAVVITGVPWRTGWRYRERGYRHVYWDAGTVLSQLLAAADSVGHVARLYTTFADSTVADLVGADGIHEFPVAIVGLGAGPPAVESSGQAAAGSVDAVPLEFPLVTAAQRAGRVRALGAAWPAGEPAHVAVESGPPLDAVVLARGSQRLMDPDAALAREVLESSMAVATRGVGIDHWIAVHNVTGIAPGLYRWPDLASPSRAGDLREEMYHVCMDQGLGGDASFVVVSATDLRTRDDHGYREAQLSAGLVEGRLHLAAYALGAGASGMTFVDGMIADLLGEEMDGLLLTCVGVPEYKSAAGGGPGEPVAVRGVQVRMDDR